MVVVKSPPDDEIKKEPLVSPVKHEKEKDKNLKSVYGPVEFRISDEGERLSIRFMGRYDSEWIDEIRSYGKCYYDKIHKEFLLKWTQLKVDSLSDYFSTRGVEVKVKKSVVPDDLKEQRKEFSEDVRSRQLTI